MIKRQAGVVYTIIWPSDLYDFNFYRATENLIRNYQDESFYLIVWYLFMGVSLMRKLINQKLRDL
tara:strand:- start:66 stop:260 length:195 start_codon:yes stop_codon:yes gene_type:complete